MAKRFESLNKKLSSFIEGQKIFFVATSASDGEVNLSPKGYDSFRILDKNSVSFLDYPGSGNETASHIRSDGRVTVMFCSFDKNPMILRIYGQGEVISKDDKRFGETFSLFNEDDAEIVRQIFIVKIDYVLTSCGYGVPYFDYRGEREQLKEWTRRKAKDGTLCPFMGESGKRPLE